MSADMPPMRPLDEYRKPPSLWPIGVFGAVLLVAGITFLAFLFDLLPESDPPVNHADLPPRSLPQPEHAEVRPPSLTAPILPGFQGVAVPSRGIAYDVPLSWTVSPEGVIRGYESARGRITGRGPASDGDDYCGTATRSLAFVTRTDAPDTASAATEIGAAIADIGYQGSRWGRQATSATPLTTLGGLAGHLVETSGTQQPDDPACPTDFSVYTFAFRLDRELLVLTIGADRGVAGELSPARAQQIFATVRRLN